MENQNNFAAQVAASEKAQKHAQEIQQTRIGGLGGSDATLILKIGESGLAALSATDHKRLCIMMGKTEPDNWAGNAFTNAGHLFEDWAEQNIPWGDKGYEREKILSQPLARNFKVFAHADFVEFGEVVTECKFVQGTTQNCATKYAAQLQWYYMLGAKDVVLFHGSGTADPFEVWETNTLPIARDEQIITYLLAGIKTLDEAISGGWEPEVIDKVVVSDTPEIVQNAFEKMAEVKAKKKALDAEEAEAKAVLMEYIEGFGLSGIVASDGSKHQIIYTKAGVTKTLDTGKLLEDYPAIDLGKYYKLTKRAASITFK